MADECSKSTKSFDHHLACIQMFMLDAVGPLSDILDRINGEIHRIQEDSETKPEIGLDNVAGAIKAALTLLGNASTQCLILRRTKVLEEIISNSSPLVMTERLSLKLLHHSFLGRHLSRMPQITWTSWPPYIRQKQGPLSEFFRKPPLLQQGVGRYISNKNQDFNPMVMEAPRAEARAVVLEERTPNDY